MNEKENNGENIVFRRGDTFKFKYALKDFLTKEIITKSVDKMWFSVKNSTLTDHIIIQKSLEDGTITFTDDGYYHIIINPEDTNNLKYKDYVFDIEIINNGDKLTLKVGDFTLKDEVTFAINEV